MKNRMRRLGLVFILMFTVFLPISAEEKSNQSEKFELIDALINAEVMYGLSGAQLVVYHNGDMVKQSAYGYTNSYENIVTDGEVVLDDVAVIPVEQRNAVTNDTLFDLASNTKMYAGNYAIQYLITHTDLTLETKVVDIYPDYAYQGIGVDGQSELTIGHLLRHDSGFIASPKYHDNTFTGNLGNGDNDENYLYTQDANEILDKLLLTPLEYAPGTVVRYSDVDFMLIGKIVEEVSGQTFDAFLEDHIYGPLNLTHVTFNPLRNGFGENDTSSSELHGNTRDGRVFFNNYRDTVITGEVHDEKAFYSFDGLAGHAGLFGNAKDIASLAQLMLTEGRRDGVEYFTQETIDTFMQPSDLNDTYAYGWRRQGNTKAYAWAFSEYASVNTIGHTGWTGTITQIDPDNNVVIVLLTNARNSPIMGPDKNDFYTKAFRTNDYGTITTLVYEALGLGSDVSSTDFIVSQIEKERAANKDTASNRNEMRALYTVLKDLAVTDAHARTYVLENLEADVLDKNSSFEGDTLHLDLGVLDTDKTSLLGAIDKANQFETKSELLQTALDYAALLNQDVTATQDVINHANGELSEAIRLEEKETPVDPVDEVDTSKLDALITTVSALDASKYTKESFDPLMEAVGEAKGYLENTSLEQTKVDQYYETITKLYAALVLKQTDSDKPVLPATGVTNSSAMLIGAIVGVLGLGVVCLGNKNHKRHH